MKDPILERLIISAAPHDIQGTRSFVTQTMERLRVAGNANPHPAQKHAFRTRLLQRFRQLHGPALAIAILALLLAVGGTVYAATQLISRLINIESKQTNGHGETEFAVQAPCLSASHADAATLRRFALKHDAPPTSDEDVVKILRAKCELSAIDSMVRNHWPTYGSHKVWQENDDIFYARADLLGTLQSVSDTELKIQHREGTQLVTKTYTVQPGQHMQALADDQPVRLNSLKPGDTVMSVIRVAETYHVPAKTAGIQFLSGNDANPRPLGGLGLVKLSLPLEYYTTKQNYLTDINPCSGNEQELCPNVPSIDVYPRSGGEGATNPSLDQSIANGTGREVVGTISELGGRAATIHSLAGNTYTVTLGEDGFSDYNTTYAPAYNQFGDAKLRVGSVISVRYLQSPAANPHTIEANQVEAITLLLESSVNQKQSPIKQY